MPDKCYICNIQCVLKEKHESLASKFGIPCDRCRRVVCRICTGIATSEVRAAELSARSPNVRYYCPSCSEDVSRLDSVQRQLDILTEEVARIREEAKAKPTYAEALKKVEDATDHMRNEVNGLRTVQQELEKALIETRKNDTAPGEHEEVVEDLGHSSRRSVQSSRTLDLESAVAEVREREARRKNIIVVGVRELPSAPRTERIATELMKVKELVRTVDATIPLESLTCHRIGKYNEGRHRPLRITFEKPEDSITLLKQKSKLTGDIYIKADKTKLQREHMLELIKNLEARKAGGETDLVIRYFRGSPRIVNDRRSPRNRQPKN